MHMVECWEPTDQESVSALQTGGTRLPDTHQDCHLQTDPFDYMMNREGSCI
jgi:hypothetical protein